jgi:sugar phosphate isomerase/epimerase
MLRRELLHASVGTLAVGAASTLLANRSLQAQPAASPSSPLRYCLNMSTIEGAKVELPRQIQIAAEAGYDGVELWLRDIQRYLTAGGSLADIRKQLADAGLSVDSAIAFGKWLVDDQQARRQGLEECARDMDVIRELGGRRIAAPPTGMTNEPPMDLDVAAERYRALLDLGKAHDCVPQIEVWGFSKNCYSLKQVLYICAGAAHADACILPDVYHLFKGGSDFTELRMLEGNRVHVFHMNDYPATPSRSEIKDEHRVYPGDGIAPLDGILQTMVGNGFSGSLSLELFNRDYWKQDPLVVAKTGLAKMKAAVAKALGAAG